MGVFKCPINHELVDSVESVNYCYNYRRVRVFRNFSKGESQVKIAVRILLIARAGLNKYL